MDQGIGGGTGGQGEVPVGVHVDEPRRDHQSLGIDVLGGLCLTRREHLHDAIPLDGDVRPGGWPSAPVDHLSVLDQEVKHFPASEMKLPSGPGSRAGPKPPLLIEKAIPCSLIGDQARQGMRPYFQVAYWKRGTSSTPTVRDRFLFTPYMVRVVKKGIQ